MDLRSQFVQRALRAELPFAALCREYGISTKTGYKWKDRFLANGQAGLADQSRRPKTAPSLVSEDVCCKIIELKGKHEMWGPKKIHDLYQRGKHRLPPVSLSTVKRALGKAGLTEPRRRRRPAKDCGRIANPLVATVPNEVWTVDFKGWWYSTTNERVLPLTGRDAYTCFILQLQVVADGHHDTYKRPSDDEIRELYRERNSVFEKLPAERQAALREQGINNIPQGVARRKYCAEFSERFTPGIIENLRRSGHWPDEW